MLGEIIKNYILKTGIKLSYVAKKSNIAPNTFSAIMNGKRKITAEEYFSICKALNVPLETFVITAQRGETKWERLH